MQDSNLLHFLKEFPSWIVLSTLFLIVLFIYVFYQVPFLERILDLLAGSLLTVLIGVSRKPTTPNTNVENLNTDSVNVGDTSANLEESKKEI